nr:hypothetical protein [uncultured Prevotella sp.]
MGRIWLRAMVAQMAGIDQHLKAIDNISLRSLCHTLTRLFGSPIHTQYGNLYQLTEA